MDEREDGADAEDDSEAKEESEELPPLLQLLPLLLLPPLPGEGGGEGASGFVALFHGSSTRMLLPALRYGFSRALCQVLERLPKPPVSVIGRD